MPYKDKNKKKEYARLWAAKRRAEFFDGKKCCICGSTKNLELDHIKRETKTSHKIFTWSKTKREEELKKCQILCEDCHKEKSRNEMKKPITHGTRGGYSRGCRCPLCRQQQKERMDEYRAKLATRS